MVRKIDGVIRNYFLEKKYESLEDAPAPVRPSYGNIFQSVWAPFAHLSWWQVILAVEKTHN
jgi:hypothetical protein